MTNYKIWARGLTLCRYQNVSTKNGKKTPGSKDIWRLNVETTKNEVVQLQFDDETFKHLATLFERWRIDVVAEALIEGPVAQFGEEDDPGRGGTMV